jgi:hypothetical protein
MHTRGRWSRGGLVISMMVASAAIAAAAACSDLKVAEHPPEAGNSEPDAEGQRDDRDSGATPDATDSGQTGKPPADFACSSDTWVSPAKTKPECAPRKVKVIDEGGAVDVTDLSIARTPAGRIGIVFNNELDSESGEMRLWHFVPNDSSFVPDVVVEESRFGYHAGYSTRIAASGPDVLQVLAHNVNDASGDVVLRRLENGQKPLTDPELVVSGVKKRTQLGLAVDSVGTVYAAALLRGTMATSSAKLAVRQKVGGGAFTPLPDIATTLLPHLAPETGAASLVIGPSDQLHLVYHFCYVSATQPPSVSTPRYHILASDIWSDPKTVDNNFVDGLAGFSPRLVVNGGNHKAAAYFFRKAGQAGVPTAELRLATWVLDADMPTIEVLDQGIPSEDPLSPAYRVAMSIDKFGLIHLAILRPGAGNSGSLEYRRQTRDASGNLKWLSDIVDDNVLAGQANGRVDMLVDDKARPHIAYLSGVDLKVRYATRYDR